MRLSSYFSLEIFQKNWQFKNKAYLVFDIYKKNFDSNARLDLVAATFADAQTGCLTKGGRLLALHSQVSVIIEIRIKIHNNNK